MRWRILKTLLVKEALRHATNRGGLVLAALLVTASLLLAALNPAADDDKPAMLVGGIHHCIIYYDNQDDWVNYLEGHRPAGLRANILFYPIRPRIEIDDRIRYEPGTGGIELRSMPDADGQSKFRVYVRYPEGDRASMAVYESWFCARRSDTFMREPPRNCGSRAYTSRPNCRRRFSTITCGPIGKRSTICRHDTKPPPRRAANRIRAIPELEMVERGVAGGSLDLRAAIATALVLFSLCFSCIYLMPSLTCEERERGLLLAQALSPATAGEILAAKFLFYPAFGILLATLLAGIHNSRCSLGHFSG